MVAVVSDREKSFALALHRRVPLRQRVLAFCAATDNVGLFFGEDIFVAFGAIALMHTFLLSSNIDAEPLHIAVWGIPTAICAFLIHAVRLKRLDMWLEREVGGKSAATAGAASAAKSGE